MLMNQRSFRSVLLASALLPFTATAAFAQTAPNAASAASSAVGVSDIIVTANRRAERLQDVPISVTAINAGTLRDRGVSNPQELTKLAPTLTTQNGAANAQGTNFSIRGVGTSSFQRTIEASVAVVVDDVTLIRPEMAVINFADLSQVEVLNGPQGMLFGKNASAGLVNIHTNDPKIGVTEGRVSSEYGLLNTGNGTSLFQVRGMGNLALSPNSAARINLSYVRNTPIFENLGPNTAAEAGLEQVGGNLKWAWKPSDRLSILFAADYLDSRGQGAGLASFRSIAPGSPAQAIVDAVGIEAGPRNTQFANDAPLFNHVKVGGAQVKLEYEFDSGHTITNILAARAFSVEQAFDGDGTQISLAELFSEPKKFKQVSDELRIASPVGGAFDYQVGLFFLKGRVSQGYHLEASLGQTPPPGFTTILGGTGYQRQLLGSYAIFGQASYRLTDALRFTAGGRLTYDTVDMLYHSEENGSVIQLIPASPVMTANRNNTNFSWRGTLQYDLNRDWMIYATAARGYKGPGFSQYSLTYVRPEISDHIEFGSKSQFFDHKLTLNASVFQTKFRDFQAQVLNPATISSVVLNAGKLQTRGAELQLAADPLRGLTLSGGVAYVDAHFVSFTGDLCYLGQPDCVGGTTDSSGRVLPNAPKWKGTAAMQYKHPVSDRLTATFNAAVSAQSGINFASNGNPATVQKGYTTLDMGVGLTGDDGRWTLRAFCRNCTDTRFVTSISSNALFQTDYAQSMGYQSFRQIGAALDFAF